jgi:inner membrane protein
METPEVQEKPLSGFINWLKSSVMIKLIVVGFLILILMIPNNMLQSLIYERQQTRDDAVKEITSKWGSEQLVGSPVLTVPYKQVEKDENGKPISAIHYAHFLPENLKINGKVSPEKRYRGIYVAMLYNARLTVEGNFSYPNVALLNIPKENFMFENAFISMGITDMKGINDAINLKVNGQTLSMNPGIESNDIYASGVSTPVVLDGKGMSFSCDLNLNGSGELRFVPFGKETNVQLSANWGTPSFTGSFSPDDKKITDSNFSAHWKVLQLNRNYPQQGVGRFIGKPSNTPDDQNPPAVRVYSPTNQTIDADDQSSFGVKLMLPVDEYQKTMRSAKYDNMFILLTFVAFFFVEILNKRRLHPIQYLLVGFAVCLFYVLLLSISEHLSFNWAYLIGCGTIMGLVIFYTKSVFNNTRLTLIFNGVLAILYGFFYSLLQLESYALLIGSIGLVLILGTVMYLTRNIDWNKPM